MTDRQDHDDAGAAVQRLLDGLEPLAQRPETRTFIAGARTATDALTGRDAATAEDRDR